jgi:hypothetical protein
MCELKSRINYIISSHVIHVHAEGNLTSNNGMEVAQQVLRLAEEHKCAHVLCDYRRTTFTESFTGIYENPKRYHAIGFPLRIKIAVIYTNDESKHVFWETVCPNRGFDFRVFKAEDKALNWLKGK